MYGGSKASDALGKSEGVGRGSVDNPIRSFCKSLVRSIHLSQSSAKRDQNKAAAAAAPELGQSVHPRVIKQGQFDWGSFSAFEDGSIELERAGVKQWFRSFSELKSSLSHAAEN
jgi:hypothetical protein